MRFTFRDETSFSCSTFFAHPNECIALVRDLASKVGPLDRVLSICSGGEMPLIAFLPQANEVVAVDHTYRSLKLAMLKALIVEHYSDVRRVYNLDLAKFNEVLNTLNQELPEKMQRVQLFWDPRTPNTLNAREYGTIARTWLKVSPGIQDRIREGLDKLTFIHGDIRKVGDGFNLIYASNCFKHTDLRGSYPTSPQFVPLLKVGGGLIATRKSHYNIPWPVELGEVEKITRFHTPDMEEHELEWIYHLVQKKDQSCFQQTTSLSLGSASLSAAP